MKGEMSIGSRLFDICNVLLMLVLIALMMYPLVYVFSASISSNAAVSSGQVVLWPKSITWAAYEKLFKNPNLWISYWNTIRYTVVQTVLTLLATSAMAYPLAKHWLPGRRLILLMAGFTMLFNGGLIPTFLVVNQLGMINTMWAIVIPTLINTWYLFIMRTFFAALPEEVEEAAIIDGCSSFQVLTRIVLPLSLPVMVTIGLFTAVNQWNSFFDALIYLNDRQLYPLQIMLRSIIIADASLEGAQSEFDTTVLVTQKYALTIIAILPILFVYPFLQKYFVQGTMIGGVKG
ncbi:carbohydrate ABC transporter permease [Paenibacillus daejeonensis]|uniref:carbohydrate ABC transporter permease n=1 Tax=Paenibacillus daejeonensis TaxID=135193 RepID=UPI0003807C94|nr:carbohydrate ABC transporter permease [Paenibacillus daejeonensis]